MWLLSQVAVTVYVPALTPLLPLVIEAPETDKMLLCVPPVKLRSLLPLVHQAEAAALLMCHVIVFVPLVQIGRAHV